MISFQSKNYKRIFKSSLFRCYYGTNNESYDIKIRLYLIFPNINNKHYKHRVFLLFFFMLTSCQNLYNRNYLYDFFCFKFHCCQKLYVTLMFVITVKKSVSSNLVKSKMKTARDVIKRLVAFI